MLWDIFMMTTVQILWRERNNRIFNHTAVSMITLLHFIPHFVYFQADNLALPLKRKVDSSIITYARKSIRSAASSSPVGPASYLDLGDISSSAGALAAFSRVQVDGHVSGVLADQAAVGSSTVAAGDHLAMVFFWSAASR